MNEYTSIEKPKQDQPKPKTEPTPAAIHNAMAECLKNLQIRFGKN